MLTNIGPMLDKPYLRGNLVDTTNTDDESELSLTGNVVVTTVACLLKKKPFSMNFILFYHV